MSFRYYLYISESKVDMLLAQIDPGMSRQRSAETGVNLKVFSARRTSESPTGAARTERLQRVVRHLEDHGDLGSVDDPGQFFWGLLPMRWGPFRSQTSSLVYFGGTTENTVVGLGGSSHHVLGSPPIAADLPGLAGSMTPAMLDEISHGVLDPAEDDDALGAVREATLESRGPTQNVEFVAKRLLHGVVEGQAVLLGTPLYVAMVD